MPYRTKVTKQNKITSPSPPKKQKVDLMANNNIMCRQLKNNNNKIKNKLCVVKYTEVLIYLPNHKAYTYLTLECGYLSSPSICVIDNTCLYLKRNTCIVWEYYISVLSVNYVSTFYIGLCVSGGSYIKYTYMIDGEYNHMCSCKSFSY